MALRSKALRTSSGPTSIDLGGILCRAAAQPQALPVIPHLPSSLASHQSMRVQSALWRMSTSSAQRASQAAFEPALAGRSSLRRRIVFAMSSTRILSQLHESVSTSLRLRCFRITQVDSSPSQKSATVQPRSESLSGRTVSKPEVGDGPAEIRKSFRQCGHRKVEAEVMGEAPGFWSAESKSVNSGGQLTYVNICVSFVSFPWSLL